MICSFEFEIICNISFIVNRFKQVKDVVDTIKHEKTTC